MRGMVTPSPSLLNERLNALPGVVVAAEPKPAPAPVIPPPAALTQPVINAQIAKQLPAAADYKPDVGKRRKAKVV